MGFRLLKHLSPIRKNLASRTSVLGLQRSNNLNPAIGVLSPHQLNDHYDHLHPLPYLENPCFKISKRWHIGHSDHHHDHIDNDFCSGKEGERIFRLGLAADVGLATAKALTGYLSGSTAIIADAAHSVSDVVIQLDPSTFVLVVVGIIF